MNFDGNLTTLAAVRFSNKITSLGHFLVLLGFEESERQDSKMLPSAPKELPTSLQALGF